MSDKHKTKSIARIILIIVSALFVAIGIAGYQRTQDEMQLFLFIGLAIIASFMVIGLFKGVDKLLDKLDDSSTD